MTTYDVRARRSGNWWAFEVPAIPGAVGQARRLDQVEREARDVVALMLDAGDASFAVQLTTVTLPPELDEIVQAATASRRQLEELQRSAQERQREAVVALQSRAGLSVRDIGKLLGVSFQRIAQLTEKKAG